MDALDLPAWLTLVLALGAALRTWRLLNTDDAGERVRGWLAIGLSKMGTWGEIIWQGIRCPYCLSVWLCGFWVSSALAWGDSWPWQLLAGTLALSWVAGHAGARLDEITPPEPVDEAVEGQP